MCSKTKESKTTHFWYINVKLSYCISKSWLVELVRNSRKEEVHTILLEWVWGKSCFSEKYSS